MTIAVVEGSLQKKKKKKKPKNLKINVKWKKKLINLFMAQK